MTVDGAAFCSLVTVDFGDGQSQMVHHAPGLPLSVSHTWATAGPKMLTATGHGASCDYQATKPITVLTPPSVSVTAPTGGATFNAPATIAIAVSASAAQGTIASVDFFANGSLLHTGTTTPFAYSWTGVAVGTYALTARATDTQGGVATSSSVNVIVGTPPPSTVLGLSVTPAVAGQAATVTATGTNPCGMIWMDFGDGDWFIIPISGLPFQWNKVWATPGTYTVLAKGFHDCYGEVTQQITVSAAPPAPADDAATGVELQAPFTPELQAPFTPEPQELSTPELQGPFTPVYPSADEPEREAAPDLAPAEQSTLVLVNISGTGGGTVTGTLPCTGTNARCVGYFEPGQAITVTATPAAGSVFTGWTGVCATSGPTCAFGAVHGVLAVANFRSTFTPETVYYHLDPLGSVRAVTSAAGAVLERHDYRPFGEDNMPLPAPGADPSRFLGQQRDQTKLDQFGARYYSMFTGRFTGVDPVINPGAVASPQRWNRYAYALNNPLRYTDTTGLDADGGDTELAVPECTLDCQSSRQYANSDWLPIGLANAYIDEQTGGVGGLRPLYVVDMDGGTPFLIDAADFSQWQRHSGVPGLTWNDDGTICRADKICVGTFYYIEGVSYVRLVRETGDRARDHLMGHLVVMGSASAVAAGGGVAVGAARGGISVASRLTTLGRVAPMPSSGQMSLAQQILRNQGRDSLEKSMRSWQRSLEEAIVKRDAYRRAGAPWSDQQRTINNMQGLLSAARILLGGG